MRRENRHNNYTLFGLLRYILHFSRFRVRIGANFDENSLCEKVRLRIYFVLMTFSAIHCVEYRKSDRKSKKMWKIL